MSLLMYCRCEGSTKRRRERTFVDAAARHVAQATCELAIVPLEDIAGVVEQPNLPGTTDEHPNWRRRMPADTGLLLRQPDIAARLHAIDRIRQ